MKYLKVKEVKKILLDFHRKIGFQIFESFPLVTDDPTVMFLNATITPFKRLYVTPGVEIHNFALIQKCFRAGGSQSLRETGYNPSLSSCFEMFGSGIFGIDHYQAVSYLLEALGLLGLEKEKFFFTIPNTGEFEKALVANGITQKKIFEIPENGHFWCNWQFGKHGPTGRGLTLIYSQKDVINPTLRDLSDNEIDFVELLNLIHIYGQEKDGIIIPAANEGFEVGMGIGRVASIIQGVDCYMIDNMRPYVDAVRDFHESHSYDYNIGYCRACADYLFSICLLTQEGVLVSNKGSGYVLRKIIRILIESVWEKLDDTIDFNDLVIKFCCYYSYDQDGDKSLGDRIVEMVDFECQSLKKVIRAGRGIIRKNPHITDEVLRDTYGLSESLKKLAMKGR